MTYSFDVFDTCLVRKCGSAYNMVDILSTLVFKTEVEEWERQEFVIRRINAERELSLSNPYGTIKDLYDILSYDSLHLKPKKEIIQIEMGLEDSLLVPVISVRSEISELRNKGNKIIFISDMYLPRVFIEKKLKDNGLYMDGDSVYVSCELGKSKNSGQLFEFIQKKERLSKNKWKHIGDNLIGDFKQPRSKGIKATCRVLGYNAYPQKWISEDFSLGFKYKKILAGLSRACVVSSEKSCHANIVYDVIGPLYNSWVYLILKEAQKMGVHNLYFCARDSFIVYKVALLYQRLFPSITIKYIYLSRKSIYNPENRDAKINYFKRIGLANHNEDTALVDITSSGRMLAYINDFLKNEGYSPVYMFLFSLWHLPVSYREFYRVTNFDDYVKLNFTEISLTHFNWMVYESFFSLNREVKTHDYILMDNQGEPLFYTVKEKDECELRSNTIGYVEKHEEMIIDYSKSFLELNLFLYSDKIFENVSIPTLINFFRSPCPQYLGALTEFYVNWGGQNHHVPYVRQTNFLFLFFNKLIKRRNYFWFRGSLAVSLPIWALRIINFLWPNSFYLLGSKNKC